MRTLRCPLRYGPRPMAATALALLALLAALIPNLARAGACSAPATDLERTLLRVAGEAWVHGQGSPGSPYRASAIRVRGDVQGAACLKPWIELGLASRDPMLRASAARVAVDLGVMKERAARVARALLAHKPPAEEDPGFTCSMHPDVHVEKMGACPICDMKLVPAKPRRDKGPAWTCGMHPEIRRAKKGACPICGMDLVPWRPPPEPTVGPWIKQDAAAALMALGDSAGLRYLVRDATATTDAARTNEVFASMAAFHLLDGAGRGDSKQVARLLAAGLHHDVRLLGAAALVRLGRHKRLGALRKAAGKSDVLALYLLGRVGEARDRPLLRRLSSEEEPPKTRLAAAGALARLGEPAALRKLLAEHPAPFRSDDPEVFEWLRAVGGAGDPRLFARFVPLLGKGRLDLRLMIAGMIARDLRPKKR